MAPDVGGEKFWASPQAEPKRAYRWLLHFGDGLSVPQWIVTKVSQPGFEISEHEHKYLNHSFFYPGRVTWNEVSLTLVDPLNPDATSIMREMLFESGYLLPTDPNVQDTISKARATSRVNKFSLKLLGPKGDPEGSTGNIVGEWNLHNPWIKKVDFGELSYDSDELVNLTLSVRYDWAVYRSYT
ncbi:hypothetical protein CL634_10865 [bacterium]|nr:hypothetical protein [bacterium]|tara:strand:+ start:1258 stop:1809 length:552 start_codon:yes stop_codon:yes gene_type:complete